MSQVTVNTPGGSYAVIYRRGALARLGALLTGLRDSTGVYVISSPRVWKHWGRKMMRGLGAMAPAAPLLFDDRESRKDLRSVEQLCGKLIRAGADRRALIVGVGGGVVGDVAGFVAASYLRGVRIVHVPTTLVAQIDSAIGGKTGVNLPDGKNLVGAFYQPRLVAADPRVLDTLPPREFRSGIYEVIKYAVLGDPELFLFLEERRMLEGLVARAPAVLDWVIPRCIAAKARIVSKDERESGLREVLNLGHTFGHALEAATGYKRFLHGEAVGWGLIAAAQTAAWLRKLSIEEAIRIELLVREVGTLPPVPKMSHARLLRFLRADKKVRDGKLRFVLPRAIGRVEVCGDVNEGEACELLRMLARDRA
jgi:3-dehydroquinate synthase